MASRKTIVLFIIFFGLLVYVYFFEIKGEKRNRAQKEKEELVLNLDKEKVAGLSFLPQGISIEKDGTLWKILLPVQTHADHSTIESILDAFSWLKKGRYVSDNPDDFKKFGLTPYQLALVISQQEGISDTLFLGDTNLDSTKVFYRNNGSNKVYLVSTTLKSNATKSLYDLRDKSVLKFKKQEISKISIKNNYRTFSCYKDKDQQWWLEHPIRTLCDDDKIDDILNELNNSKIASFESEYANNLGIYDLHNPWLTISLLDSSEEHKPILYVGKKEKKEYYAKNDLRSAIFLIDSSLVAKLNVSLFDLRDKTMVSFEQDSVTEISIQYPDFIFHCIKDSTNRWIITQPDSGLAKSWKISSLLYDIKDLEVAQFIDDLYQYKLNIFYGFDRPEIKLTLKKENIILVDLLIGKQVDNKLYVKNNLTNKIFLVKTKAKDDLLVKPEEFIDEDF